MNSPNRKRRTCLLVLGLISVSVFAVLLIVLKNVKGGGNTVSFNTQSDFIEFIDVGQGDCALIYSNGYCALIDLGENTAVSNIRNTLNRYDIKQIDAVIVSHLHSDHVGALPEISKLYEIDNLFIHSLSLNSTVSAITGKDNVIKNGGAVYTPDSGINFNIGEFELTVLGDMGTTDNLNNSSTYVMAKIGDKKILFTGDAETDAENNLLKQNLNIDCDILKVAHHGSDSSTGNQFLKIATPKYAVISVGKDNSYNQPNSKTLKLLENIGAEVFRTDKDGNITFNFNKGNITVKTEK